MQPYDLAAAEADLRAAIDADDRAAIDRLEPIIHQLDAASRHRASLYGAALWYAEQGLHVFPLSPGTKIPFKGTAGCKDATTDAAIIASWWTEHPDANIAIATGYLVDVIDIDGPTGVASWLELADDLPSAIGKVSTPRPGGTHLYVHANPERGNRAGIFAGIDYRGLGGYVVAPPSTVDVGPHPGGYVWLAPINLEVEGAR